MSGAAGASEVHAPRAELGGASTAAKRKLQPNFSPKVSLLLWDFPARRTVPAPRGRLAKHSFIPTCKGRNTR